MEFNAYYDLNVSEDCFMPSVCEKTLKTLYHFGYRTIAINQFIEDEGIDNKKKKKKGEPRDSTELVPNPFDLDSIKKCVEHLNLHNFNVLNRLTVAFANQEVFQKITKSKNYKKFNIIAAMPRSPPAFMFTCGTLEADIFSIDPESKMNLKMNRKLYRQLMDRGYHFELLYSPAIQDSTKRKNLIHLSHLYHTWGKSKNIFFSSGASSPLLLRSPYDIINLGLIFGLSEIQCKSAISENCRNVIINSVGRRHGKAIMFVENVEDKMEGKTEDSIIMLEDSDEDMAIDQPAQKKSKQ